MKLANFYLLKACDIPDCHATNKEFLCSNFILKTNQRFNSQIVYFINPGDISQHSTEIKVFMGRVLKRRFQQSHKNNGLLCAFKKRFFDLFLNTIKKISLLILYH